MRPPRGPVAAGAAVDGRRPPALLPSLGMAPDDAFDLTPERQAAARAAMDAFRTGPLYTPPSLEGSLVRPSGGGVANWGGGAFDPETGMLYVKSSNVVGVAPNDLPHGIGPPLRAHRHRLAGPARSS